MTLKVEGVVNGGMHAEEMLGRSSRFEPLHLQHRRNLSARSRRAQLHRAAVELCLPSIRPLKAAREGLVEKLPRSRRYRLPAEGYSVCLICLKLFDRVYAPLTIALLNPIPTDKAPPRPEAFAARPLYQRLTDTLDHLLQAVGLAFAPTINENKIPVDAPITA